MMKDWKSFLAGAVIAATFGVSTPIIAQLITGGGGGGGGVCTSSGCDFDGDGNYEFACNGSQCTMDTDDNGSANLTWDVNGTYDRVQCAGVNGCEVGDTWYGNVNFISGAVIVGASANPRLTINEGSNKNSITHSSGEGWTEVFVGTKPTCDSTIAPQRWVTHADGGGARSTIEWCLESDSNTYSWVTIGDGGA